MAKRYIGKGRSENLEWLKREWLPNGPSVCFLQGFSGVGKTDLARDLREQAEKDGWQYSLIEEITDRATASVVESLMQLSVRLSRHGLVEMERVLFEDADPNLAYALEKALKRRIVLILDEAQRFFHPESGTPLPEMVGIFTLLRARPGLPGRLLLLTDRVVEQRRWSEWIPIRTLAALEPNEAVELLQARLAEAGLPDEIDAQRKADVVRDLDFNPRAIEALVGALRYEPLDEIIGSNPGLWAVEDREVDRDFLRRLERDLLERTMRHLDAAYQRGLWRLAVHRRSFKRDALEQAKEKGDDTSHLLSILRTRFLVNHYKGMVSLNPIVREISLAHLRENRAEFRSAHSSAAEYHLRHFRAKRLAGDAERLGESFAELRYHLAQAGRQAEVPEIAYRFADHLKHRIQYQTPPPSDAEELEELIGSLTVLLDSREPQHRKKVRGSGLEALGTITAMTGDDSIRLEFHLAHCLYRRGAPGDLTAAVERATHAVGKHSPDVAWRLLATMKLKAEGREAALETVRKGLEAVPDSALLYEAGGNILAGSGPKDAAIAFLEEGIRSIPPAKGSFSVYRVCAGLLADEGHVERAVALLQQGIESIPDHEAPELYLMCGELLSQIGESNAAVAVLRNGIRISPADQSLSVLCAELLAATGNTEEALIVLRESIEKVPVDKNRTPLIRRYADLLGDAGRKEEALAVLRKGISDTPPEQDVVMLYEGLGNVLCRLHRPAEAIAALHEGIYRIPRIAQQKLHVWILFLCAFTGDRVTLASTMRAGGRRCMQLGEILECVQNGDFGGGAALAARSREEYPMDVPFASQEAFGLLASGDLDGARAALASIPLPGYWPASPHGWLMALIQLRSGRRAQAAEILSRFLGRPIDESKELNETYLLRIWDQQEDSPHNHRVCRYFPILPPSITGLRETVRRYPFSPPALPEGFERKAGADGQAAPEIYVSYAWGEDPTEEGKRREEIVNRLCAAVRASGREIGRDKERLRGGDSIDRFAKEIAQAKHVIAVISSKSLHSEFCMPRELFGAFQRCSYDRQEFQKKVIALVMEDAKPLLQDDFAVIALAQEWKQRAEKLGEELRAIDPARRSHDMWRFVSVLEEMVPRLPDMLAALNDIVMKRGFEEIVRDGFREVIELLP